MRLPKRGADLEGAAGCRIAPGVKEPAGQGERALPVRGLVGKGIGIRTDRYVDSGGKTGGQPANGDVAGKTVRKDGHPDDVLTDSAAGHEVRTDKARSVDHPLQLARRRPPIIDEGGIVADRTDAEAHGLGSLPVVHGVAVPVGKLCNDGDGVARGHFTVVVEVGEPTGQVVVDILFELRLHRPGTGGYHGDAARPAGGEPGGGGSGCAGGDGRRRYAAEVRVDRESHGGVRERHPAAIQHPYGYISRISPVRYQPVGIACEGDLPGAGRTHGRNDQAEQDREDHYFLEIHTEIREP
ncbi:hypothetical protein DSECCO2_626140 [anaerobic digester metagenome]